MNTRKSRPELMFSLVLLLLLVVAAGAFFYGVKVGIDRTEAKQVNAPSQSAVTASSNAYQQQDLVSFYHTVFLANREFQSEWFSIQHKWLVDPTSDRSASLKQLSKLATKKYEEIKGTYVSPASPLLVTAQTEYMKSLKLFSNSFSSLASTANDNSADAFLGKLDTNSYFNEARIHLLSAQKTYYAAMLVWASTIDSDTPSQYEVANPLPSSTWSGLPLLIKNIVSADFLESQALITEYTPQDLTARIDQFLLSGQADKRNLTSFQDVAELLTGTEGVRVGDFLEMKARLYEGQQLPQLPFFFSDK
ncbi:MAG: hypothetical protein P0Y55_06320 [Candidatus Cohnella colombiensis]|uniref:Uncharacterized protein n=1 Tax=Candidatus Cohnella colombiensis TaxID=3121368 RepID=A0AA95JBP6_9BACL|nr:MAG: hypothetical protein P0Y55_06320 [Cohnella sp.]